MKTFGRSYRKQKIMNGFKPNPNDIIKKLAIFKTSVSEFGVLKLILKYRRLSMNMRNGRNC